MRAMRQLDDGVDERRCNLGEMVGPPNLLGGDDFVDLNDDTLACLGQERVEERRAEKLNVAEFITALAMEQHDVGLNGRHPEKWPLAWRGRDPPICRWIYGRQIGPEIGDQHIWEVASSRPQSTGKRGAVHLQNFDFACLGSATKLRREPELLEADEDATQAFDAARPDQQVRRYAAGRWDKMEIASSAADELAHERDRLGFEDPSARRHLHSVLDAAERLRK
jgi:hypothetical protein